MQFENLFATISTCLYLFLGLNFLSPDHGSKISVNLIGPLYENFNLSKDYVTVGFSNDHKSFDIDRKFNEIRTISFDIQPESKMKINISFTFTTNSNESISFQMFVDTHSIETEIGVISAAIILLFLNILIGTEIMHRTIAAIFTAFTSIGVLAVLHDRPTATDIVSWINCEPLLLIFSMMVIVAILADVGFFAHIAIWAYQVGQYQRKLLKNWNGIS